jgi:hypothetical protein
MRNNLKIGALELSKRGLNFLQKDYSNWVA